MHKFTAMQFTTPVPVFKSDNPLGYGSRVLSLGSCFAVNMAEKLAYYQFRHTVNPFGILFHPQAIEKMIGWANQEKTFTRDDILFHNERWHCFDAHSDLSAGDPETLLDNLNTAAQTVRETILGATHIIITYGTAWVYRHQVSGEIVANCHKVPQADFSKEILSADSIRRSIGRTVDQIKRLNPNAHLIFTISPVRHLKDGFAENQRSKSHLIAGLHEALGQLSADYFPSYEIVMDELRDYRFYQADMIHPNQLAIDYIWECFAQSHIAADAFAVMEKVSAIQKGLSHRPFNPEGAAHQKFLSKLREDILALQKQHPQLQF